MTVVCILSDTHENELAMRDAITIIKERNPPLIIHLGDIISPLVLDIFEGLPMQFIFGNNDGERAGLIKKCEIYNWEISDELITNIDGKSIFCAHGHRDDWRIAINEQRFNYVFHGHTHLAKDERRGKTRIINPGALFRATEYSFVFIDFALDNVEWIKISK